jgi:hypothetical protein
MRARPDAAIDSSATNHLAHVWPRNIRKSRATSEEIVKSSRDHLMGAVEVIEDAVS